MKEAVEFLLNYVKRFGDGVFAPQAARHLDALKAEAAKPGPTDPTTDADLKAQGIFPPTPAAPATKPPAAPEK